MNFDLSGITGIIDIAESGACTIPVVPSNYLISLGI